MNLLLLTVYTLSSIQPSLSSTDQNYLFHDRLNKISDYVTEGNVTILSSPNCPHDPATTSQEKLCLSGSQNGFIDGQYQYLYHDPDLDASVFTNPTKQQTIYPQLSNSQILIQGYDSNINARCNLSSNNTINDIYNNFALCDGRWEIYHQHNNSWILASNLKGSNCQDLCVNGNDRDFIVDGSMLVYSHYNFTRKTDIYYCEQCGGYLYGWIYPKGTYYWVLGKNYNESGAWSTCYVADNPGNDYIFDINDCLNTSRWKTYDKEKVDWKSDRDMIVQKCNYKVADEICVRMKGGDAVFSKSWDIQPTNEQLAVGFDFDISRLGNNGLILETCDGSKCEELKQFEYDYIEPEKNVENHVFYGLPTDLTQNLSTITVKFSMDEVNTVDDVVYIDDLYLFKGIENEVFVHECSAWTKDGFGSCKSPNGEYTIYESFPQLDNEAFITTTIDLTSSEFRYSDFNLEWSLYTDQELSKNSTINVKIQCDEDEYIDERCILKQYNSRFNCISGDTSCLYQSYNLPSLCDFSQIIVVNFSLKTAAAEDRVHIDAVTLSHSDASGNDPQSCQLKTPSPTLSPTATPEEEPTTTEKIGEEIVVEDIETTHKYRIIFFSITGGLFLIVFFIWIWSKFCMINDFYRVATHLVATVFIIDVLSDILFTVYLYDVQLYTIGILTIVFMAASTLFSLIQLTGEMRQWVDNRPQLQEYFGMNRVLIYILSVFVGSSFTAIYIGVSNIINVSPFNLPLNDKEIAIYHTKRRYSILAFQNIPQIVFCAVYLNYFQHHGVDEIIYISLSFSIISMVLNTALVFMQRPYVNQVIDNVSIEYEVVDPRKLVDWTKYLKKVRYIRQRFARLVKLRQKLVNVRRPQILAVGIRVVVDIDVSILHKHDRDDDDGYNDVSGRHSDDDTDDEHEREMKIKDIIRDTARVIYTAHGLGRIARIMKKSWDLYDTPHIKNIKVFRINANRDGKRKRAPTIIPLTDMPNSVDAHMKQFSGSYTGNGRDFTQDTYAGNYNNGQMPVLEEASSITTATNINRGPSVNLYNSYNTNKMTKNTSVDTETTNKDYLTVAVKHDNDTDDGDNDHQSHQKQMHDIVNSEDFFEDLEIDDIK